MEARRSKLDKLGLRLRENDEQRAQLYEYNRYSQDICGHREVDRREDVFVSET